MNMNKQLTFDTMGESKYKIMDDLDILHPSPQEVIYEFNSSNNSKPVVNNWATRGQDVMYDSLPPIMIVFGVIANSYAFVVLLRPRLRKLIVHLPLTILAIIDSIVLLSGLMRHWLRKATYFTPYNNGLDPQIISPVSCKVFEFILYWSLTFSAWLVTLVSIERFVTICLSAEWKIRRFLTSKKGLWKVIIAIGIVIILLDLHIFWTRELRSRVNNPNKYFCENVHKYFTEEIFPWLDLFFTALVPFSVICTCNCAILIKLRNIRRNSTVSSSQSKLGSYRTTIMLLLTSFSFILLTSPVKMYLMIFQTPTPKFILEEEDLLWRVTHESYYRFFWCVFLHLQFLNHCCNFWLYSASNPHFRQEACEVLACLAPLRCRGCPVDCPTTGRSRRSTKSSYDASNYSHVSRRPVSTVKEESQIQDQVTLETIQPPAAVPSNGIKILKPTENDDKITSVVCFTDTKHL